MMEKAKIIAPLSNATCDIFALGLAIYYLASFGRPTKGPFIKDVIKFLRFLTPPSPSSSLLLNKLIK